MINSRDKGKRRELELAAFLRAHGFPDAHRGQQFQGGADSPDVVGIPGFHVECKGVEARASGSVYDWLDQATRDAGAGCIPIVAHIRNRRNWLAILALEDFLSLWGERNVIR